MTTLNPTNVELPEPGKGQAVDTPALQRDVAARFGALRKRVRLQLLVQGLAVVVSVSVALLLGAFLFDAWLELSRGMRVVVMLASLGLLGWLVYTRLVKPMTVSLGPIDLAAAVDMSDETLSLNGGEQRAARGTLAPRVATVMQLPGDPDAPKALVDEAVRRAHADLEKVDLKHHVNTPHLVGHGGWLAGVVVLPLLVALVVPTLFGIFLQRWFLLSDEPWPKDTTIEIVGLDEDGRLVVPRGERVEIVARTTVKEGGDEVTSARARLRHADGDKERLPFERTPGGDWVLALASLTDDMTMRVDAGDATLGPVTVHPVERPRVTGLRLTSTHPWKDEREVFDFALGAGRATAFMGAEAELVFETNVAVDTATVTRRGSGGGSAAGEPTVTRLDDTRFKVSWTHEQAMQLNITLVGAEAGLASHPYPVTIGLQTDARPGATLQRSVVRELVTPSVTIPLDVVATDDWGLMVVELTAEGIRSDGGAAVEGEAPVAPEPVVLLDVSASGGTDESVELPKRVETPHAYLAAPHALVPGDRLVLRTRATDNRRSGAQTVSSTPLTFRIVAPDELMGIIQSELQDARSLFEGSAVLADELRAGLVEAKLPGDQPDLVRAARLIRQQTAQAQRALSDASEEMLANELGGRPVYDRMQREVIRPMDRLLSLGMAEQRDALDQLAAGSALSEDEQIEVWEAAVTRQDEITAEMRLLLQAMSEWDRFRDLINQLDETIRLQEEAMREAREAGEALQGGVFD